MRRCHMEYLSCSDASKAMGFSVRRIQQMCKNGELPGAIKEGRKWLIPDETIHVYLILSLQPPAIIM